MAYVPSNPPSDVDKARARLNDLGDISILPQWLYVSELSGGLTNAALANLADAMAAYYALNSGGKLTLHNQTVQDQDLSKYFANLAKTLREEVVVPLGGYDPSAAVGTLPGPCPDPLGFVDLCDPLYPNYAYRLLPFG